MECHPKTHQRDDQKALSDYVLIPSSHHRPRTFNIKHTLLILVGRAVTSRTNFEGKQEITTGMQNMLTIIETLREVYAGKKC